ncbi:Bro-N domain-containing protein [Clostridioides difficile]|uniref:BRO-N domain-containing protein n=1 Tax=Clostridioides difficile TaxID=1496 RepID=UPI001F2ACCC6|nr:BRO family protein [Clostridioides difficile]
MMNDLQIFKSEDFGEIRTVDIDNEIWFVGKDIAEALGYSNTREALKTHIDNDDIAEVVIHDGSQNRNMKITNESGLYSLIFGSKLETAKNFKNWVTKEVLPAIRQHGAYITNNANPEKLREKASEIEKLQLAYNSTSMLKELLDDAGFDNKSKLLTAKTLYKKAGIDLPIEIDEEEHYFDTKQIASKLKIYSKSNKPAQMAICEIIKKIKLEENEVKEIWETNGSWTGTVNKYTKV